MKNPNKNRLIMFVFIFIGLLIAGSSKSVNVVEPIHPLFIVGTSVAVGAVVYGVVTVRCPYCHKLLRLKKLFGDSACPYCGKKFEH